MATGPSIERHIQKAGKRLSKGLENVSYVPVTSGQLADRHIVTVIMAWSFPSPPFGVSAFFYILSIPPPPAVSCVVTRVSNSTRSTPAGQGGKGDILCIRSVRLGRSSLFRPFEIVFLSSTFFSFHAVSRFSFVPYICNCDLR